MTTGPLEGELLPAVEPADPHALTLTPYPWGTAWTCGCGKWEGVSTGPSSAAWVEQDRMRHIAASQPKEPRA